MSDLQTQFNTDWEEFIRGYNEVRQEYILFAYRHGLTIPKSDQGPCIITPGMSNTVIEDCTQHDHEP